MTFINHATFLLRFPGTVVLTDPIFRKRWSPVSWAGPAAPALPESHGPTCRGRT